MTGVSRQMGTDWSNTTRRRLSSGKVAFRSFALFLFAGTVAFCFLVLSPLGAFRVEITVDSSVSGNSQMFFAAEASDFSENQSQSQRVVTGSNRLAFVGNPIRETVASSLRWDPLDEPAVIEIESLEVEGYLLRERFEPSEVLRPSLDVSQVVTDGNAALIQTFSNDGQVIVDIDLEGLYQRHVLAIVATSLSVGLVASLVGALVWSRRAISGLSIRSAGLGWQVLVIVSLGAFIAIAISWGLVAR